RPLDALAAHRQAVRLWSELAREYPEVPVYRRQLANTHNAVGRVYYQLSQSLGPVKGALRHRGPLGVALAAPPSGPLARLTARARAPGPARRGGPPGGGPPGPPRRPADR